MAIGLGIILLVLGAVMRFTDLDDQLLGMDLNTVGIILMIGGGLALLMSLILNAQRTRTSHTVVQERRGGPDVVEQRGGPDVVEQRGPQVDQDRGPEPR